MPHLKMSENKVYHCLHNACTETFKHRMQQRRHLKKGCKGTPIEKPIETIVKSGTGYVCTICTATLKHQNNVKRHEKYAKVLRKT